MSLETSLPPLPSNGKSGSSLNISEGIELPPLQDQSVNGGDEDDDDLQNHYLRVQEAVLNSADAKIKEMSSKLHHTELLLRETKEEKDGTGIALYRTRKEITHLNKIITKNRVEQDQVIGDKSILSQQLEATTTSLEASKIENHDLTNAMKELQRKFEESQLKILQLRDINTNYTSEIKIQKRINSKLKKEMEVVSEKAKFMEEGLEKERAKTEQMFTNSKSLEGLLSQQQAEVRAAKAAIETLHKENNLLEKTRGATEKQWEDSLIAMSGRDKAIQSMQDHKQNILTKLSESEVANRVYKAEQESLQARLSKKEQECEQLSQMNAQLKTELKDISNKFQDNVYNLNQSRYSEKSFSKEVEELSKTIEGHEKEIQNKINIIASLKDKLKNNGLDAIDSQKFNIDIEEVAKREDRIQEEADEQLKIVKREGEAKNVTIRYDLATLRIEYSKKETELFDLQKSYDALKEQNQDLNRHYLQLHETSKEMAYCLERKEHDINLTKAKTDALEEDHKKGFDTVIAGLQTEIKSSRAEKDQLKTLWLESQRQLAEEQSKFARLDHENNQLHTKLGIVEGVKQKTGNEMKNVKEESFEHKQEAAKLHNELKKMQPIIAELQEQNKNLEHKLHEAELKLEESYANHTTTKHMLRTEIRRLTQDRSHLRQDKADYDRSVMHIERNTLLYKEMIDKLKAEKYELQKSVFELKRRSDEADKRYFDIKMKLRQIEKIEAQKAEKRINNTSKLDAQGKWKSFTSMESNSELPPTSNSTPGVKLDDQTKHDVDKVIQSIPDFDGMRLKLESLSSEKEYLMNENSLLSNRLTKINTKYEDLQKSYADSKKQVKDLTGLRAEQIDKIGMLDKRYTRAKKVAAYMEKQLKDGRPNTKIDYMMIGNAEPSTQLLASLMAKDTKQVNMNSLPANIIMPSQNRRAMLASQRSSKQLV